MKSKTIYSVLTMGVLINAYAEPILVPIHAEVDVAVLSDQDMANQAEGGFGSKDELEEVVEQQMQKPQESADFVAPAGLPRTQQRAAFSEQKVVKKNQNQTKKSSRSTGSKERTSTKIEGQSAMQQAPAQAYASAKGSIIPEFDEKAYTEQRRKSVVALVEKGVAYLKNHTESEAMSAFTFNKEFIDGELYLFVYNQDAICLANGDDDNSIWKDMSEYTDVYGNFIVKIMIDQARQGGGWITYQWRNATKVTYVQQVLKDGKVYTIGAGYYPDSKRDASVSLVRSAVEHFKKTVAAKRNPEEAFSDFSYPAGKFVFGDLYLFALDFNGNIMAQGDRPGLIGQNSLEYRDADGKYVNKEIIAALNASNEGVWIEYSSKRASKITYAEKVTDQKGKNYFIACGYYPGADRRMAVDLVRQGYQYMASHGKTQAASEFNSKTSNAFRYGDIYLMVYDMQGLAIAHGGNTDYVGANQWNLQDDEGKFIVREIIEQGKNGGGWVDFKLKNASWFVYVEPIKVGKENYVIAAGVYPISKPETLQLLVKGGVSLLADESLVSAMGLIAMDNGPYLHGDMSLFVFDEKGICYSYNDDSKYIWRQMLGAQDDDGREFVKLFINTAKRGPGRVTYKETGRIKYGYVEPLEKDGKFYVVGSSFFK